MSRIRLQAVIAGAAGLFLIAAAAFPQEGGGGGGGGQGGGGGAPAPSAPSVPSTPSPSPTPTPTPSPTRPTRPTPFPTEQEPTRTPSETFPQDMQRPIYISGRVMLSDGTPPPEPVVIERVCNGIARPEGYTDSRGRFSIQLGQNQFVFADASVGGYGGTGFPGSQSSSGGVLGPMGGGVSERDLSMCEIRASLAGYQSDQISLAGRRFMDRPDIGTIVLHRYGNVEGATISVTAMSAPKDAVKSFDKGRDAIRKQKWEDARKNLEKAVQVYPKYASAWYELGKAYEKLGNQAAARDAYQKSIEADNRYLPPYVQMATMAAESRNWPEVLETTDRILRLDPYNYPAVHLYNAVANFNLKRYTEAEKSAREVLKLDKARRLPQANHILGVILAQRGDFQGAAENMRAYLKLAPNASNAQLVKDQLAKVEQLMQTAHSPQ